MGNQLVYAWKTIDAVLQETGPEDEDYDNDRPHGVDQGDGVSESLKHDTNTAKGAIKSDGGASSSATNASDAPSEDPVDTRLDYSHLLQLLKSKDFASAISRMELDQEEYGRALRDARESHISDPHAILEFVIKSKFFDSVKTNNKHASAVYAVLYMGLEIDATEALHFLLVHTSTEFDHMCVAITKSTMKSALEQHNQETSAEETGSTLTSGTPSESGSEMAIVNVLSKIFEAVTRMMNDYAYVESFGLRRMMLILSRLQPVVERHALELLNTWLKTSRFDEYALTIPSNDWKLYESYQLSKLSPSQPSSTDSSTTPSTASNSSGSTTTQESSAVIPSVRVGGKLDHTKVVLCLEQFSAISQLIENYKTYIRRTYEKGIEEMMEKGHTFVDLGESPIDGLPPISTQSETVHNIRAYVSEPVQMFSFAERKSESYKQLESWFLGSALLAAYSTTTPTSSANTPTERKHTDEDDHSDMRAPNRATSSPTPERREVAQSEAPSPASVFAQQKVDQIFSLLKRSLERSFASKQYSVSLTLARRVVALCPSFLLSLLLRRIKTSLPKPSVDTNYDITSKILDFHGEPLDAPVSATSNIANTASPPSQALPSTKPSSALPMGMPSSPASPSLSSWYSGLGGLMSFVGTNATSAVSTAAAGVIGGRFGITDGMLVSAPSESVWHDCDLATICASLNDLALCPPYFAKLLGEAEKILNFFEKTTDHRLEIMGVLGNFKRTFPELFSVASYIQPLIITLVPGTAYYLHQFWRTSYEIGEQEFRAFELNDPWMAVLRVWLKSTLEPLKSVLQPQVMELCVAQVSSILASNIERLMLRKKFTTFGALAMDSHLRSLIAQLNALLPQPSSFAVRQKFAILKEVMTIFCLENENEILEIWNAAHDDESQFFDPTMEAHTSPATKKVTVKWHLSASQAKAYMKCRREWRPQLIDSLQLS